MARTFGLASGHSQYMNLFDAAMLSTLLGDLGVSARRRLLALCRDLATQYPKAVRRWRLPVGYFRFLADRLDPAAWSGWKVVGWVENMNDLLFFLDLEHQLRRGRHRQGLVRMLYAACEEELYENRYFEDLFPGGEPKESGLLGRLEGICRRLALDTVQEAILLDPTACCLWIGRAKAQERRLVEEIPLGFTPNFERAEPAWCLGIGTAGGWVVAPPALRREVQKSRRPARLHVHRDGLDVSLGSRSWPLLLRQGTRWVWSWSVVPPQRIEGPGDRIAAGLTVGPTIRYRRGEPHEMLPSPADLPQRISTALDVLKAAWPAGFELVRALTTRIVPVHAAGVVSYSDRTRPGLSCLNTVDRGNLELVDDLLHENSHHHLNLILRRDRLRRKDRHQEVFYSPWRKSLRSLHGILHATFTFTMGACLFDRLASWLVRPASRSLARRRWLGRDALARARFRCLEEVASVRYALYDLTETAQRLEWLTPQGVRLVTALRAALVRIEPRAKRFRPAILRSPYGAALRRHERRLAEARALYTPRLGRSGRITGGNRKREKA
ncbi:MAG: aKG-HExxH-type peptide beta-hydroxylase [Nitrospirales bacterium]